MKLTNKELNEIWRDIKTMKISKEDFFNKYQVTNSSNYVMYIINIEFKRGTDYNKEGIISRKCYENIVDKINNGHELHFGEINGKHSEVSIDFIGDELKFDDNEYDIENYIRNNDDDVDDYDFDNWISECNNNCKCMKID